MATSEYDKKNCTRVNLKLNNKTDSDIIEKLEAVDNVQGFIKKMIRKEIKEDMKMKRYIIKPEYLDNFGPEANAMTELTDSDIERFAADWEMSEDDLRDQLIEVRETGFTAIHRFEGNPDWQQLNRLIAFDSGVDEPYCETEDDYRLAVHEGFIRFDGYYTTIYED